MSPEPDVREDPVDLAPSAADGEHELTIGRGDVNLRASLQMREYVAIADRVASQAAGPILDWGCGYGQMTHLMQARGATVTAFDWHPDAPLDGELVRLDHYPDVVAHRSSDPVRLPFADHSFSCALSCGVLEHVQDPSGSLVELHRVLVPEGRLFVYKLPNRFSYLEALAARMGLYYHGALENDEVYTRRKAVALLSAHRFRVDAVRRRNLVPLTVTHPLVQSVAGPLWFLNNVLARLPLVSLMATNLELDATAE